MMRSLYSGVSGLKVHQTKMDVIGNNISNVNTVGFKSSSVSFTDVFYQTTQAASGPNAETGMGGTNAKQIGIGSTLGAITTNIKVRGGSQRTDNPFDVMISGDSFFVVSDGINNYFTKAGNFNVDAYGMLVTSSGKTVMGWRTDSEGEIIRDRVKSLPIMSQDKMTTPPEATTKATVFGNVNRSDDAFAEGGNGNVPLAVQFYDQLGYEYSANFIIEQQNAGVDGKYTVKLESVTRGAETVWPATGEGVNNPTFDDMELEFNMTNDDVEVNRADNDDNAGTTEGTNGTVTVGPGGVINPTPTIEYDFSSIMSTMGKLEIDFSTVTNYGSSTSIDSDRGDLENHGRGKAVGEMSSISIQQDGKIVASYSNGDIKCVGQIAVATFANPAGLEKVGDNLYAATLNSGEFNGIGKDITADGGSLATGVLEMSNVDLSSEFTEMIVTQRGFQANSRIITTSDTMLEELINLKR